MLLPLSTGHDERPDAIHLPREVGLQKPNLRIASADYMGIPFTMQKMISIYIHNRCALWTVAFRPSLEKRNLTIVLHPDGELGSVDKSSKRITWPAVKPSFASGRLIFSLKMHMRVDPCVMFLAFFL